MFLTLGYKILKWISMVVVRHDEDAGNRERKKSSLDKLYGPNLYGLHMGVTDHGPHKL